MIRDAIIDAGFRWRPYVFRHYFDTNFLLAEGAGMILRDYRVFWMGHKGDIEAQYTTNKYRLPDTLVEDMRGKYERAAKFFLETRVERVESTPKQKVVDVSELGRYLEMGWEYVTALPDGKVIVKKL